MGDDDDDLTEALASVVWDPVGQDLFDTGLDRAFLRQLGATRTCVGNLRARRRLSGVPAWRSRPSGCS